SFSSALTQACPNEPVPPVISTAASCQSITTYITSGLWTSAQMLRAGRRVQRVRAPGGAPCAQPRTPSGTSHAWHGLFDVGVARRDLGMASHIGKDARVVEQMITEREFRIEASHHHEVNRRIHRPAKIGIVLAIRDRTHEEEVGALSNTVRDVLSRRRRDGESAD